jgi:hypothetical protein
MKPFLYVTVVGVLTLVAGLASPAAAVACDPCCYYKTVVCYETVCSYETRQVPYTRCVTRLDECGRPYTVTVTCYKDVQIPVTKVVSVAKRVKVCD